MERKYKTILIIINIIFAFIIISIPTFILLAEFSHYSRIDKSLTYIHSSSISPPFKKELNINAEIGLIDIKYTTQPVDYLVKIDIDIEMTGPNLDGKSYSDFFNIDWENMTSPVNFTLELVSDTLVDFSNLHKANIIISIMLRADILFDINASIIDGAIEFSDQIGISVGNLFLNVDRGNIDYDFTRCTVEGNIIGTVNHGNITLKSHNNRYIQNSKLTFSNEWGYILIDIYQYEEMGANITGTVFTRLGIIKIIYKDDSPNVGARFVLYNKTAHGAEGQNSFDGFERNYLPLMAGQYYYSNDFPSINNYNFSLFKWDGGDYLWNLYSIPL